MHNQYVLRVRPEPIVALVRDLIQECKGRTMMIRPVIVGDAAPEVALGIIRRTLRCVNDIVFVPVLQVQEV